MFLTLPRTPRPIQSGWTDVTFSVVLKDSQRENVVVRQYTAQPHKEPEFFSRYPKDASAQMARDWLAAVGDMLQLEQPKDVLVGKLEWF